MYISGIVNSTISEKDSIILEIDLIDPIMTATEVITYDMRLV